MDTLTAIDKMHTYYNDAFGHLITITLILVTFMGIVSFLLPIILSWMQSRSFKNEKQLIHAQLSDELKNEMLKYFSEQTKFMENQINKEISIKTKAFNEMISSTSAGILMVQGQAYLDKGDFVIAAHSFGKGLIDSFKAGDERHGNRCIKALRIDCLPHLEHSNFEMDPELDQIFAECIKIISKANTNNRYGDELLDLKTEIKSAKSRESAPKNVEV